MLRKLLISQCFKDLLVLASALLIVALGTGIPLPAQTSKASLPDPVKFLSKYDNVYNVVRAVLEAMDYGIELEDRAGGRLATKPYEFITGALTSSEVDKVALKNDTVTGAWLKARYTVQAEIESVTPAETLVTIRTQMEALNRDVDGTEKWMPLQSLGVIEKRILGKISLKLLGSEIQFQEKKGFWDKSPQPVPPRRPVPPVVH